MSGWVINSLLWCLSRMPTRLVIFICRSMARRMLAWNTEAARIAAINIDLCLPHLCADEKRELCWQSLMNSMLLVFELAQMRFHNVAQVRDRIVNVDGAELLHDAWQHGQGVLLLTPHLGCWEVLGAYLGGTYPVSAPLRPAKFCAFRGADLKCPAAFWPHHACHRRCGLTPNHAGNA